MLWGAEWFHDPMAGYPGLCPRISLSYPAQPAILLGNPNVEVLGRVLYTDYYYLFIIASFILLVAMIGAIVLTHDTTISEDRAPDIIKRQDIFIQTSRQL